jgi:teichuronic acid biosynthesis glycosyltransferase TuaC
LNSNFANSAVDHHADDHKHDHKLDHKDDHKDEAARYSAEAGSLHVLTLTPFFPSQENEVAGCFVKEPIDALAQIGFSSTVIAVSPIYHRRRHASSSAPARWLRYPQFPGTIGLSSAGRFLYASVLGEISRLHRRRPIDVIHAHGALPCGHAASLVSRKLQIPFVVTVHGLDAFNTCFLSGAPAEWRRRASIAVYQKASNVICVSRKVQQILQRGMPAAIRSTVIYNGTDTELFSAQPATDPATSATAPSSEIPNPARQGILIVGNLIPSKGHELVLRAIHRIADSFPQLQCRIIGEGPDGQRLEALAIELGIRQRVVLSGRQSRAAVADAMRRCSIFVLPSSNEGLGCVYLEAMACGKPVIACRGQGIEEIIEHRKNGWLIFPDNLDELQQAISTLLRSPEQAESIGLAAHQTILSGLTLAQQAQRLATLYRLGASNRAL